MNRKEILGGRANVQSLYDSDNGQLGSNVYSNEQPLNEVQTAKAAYTGAIIALKQAGFSIKN